MEENTSQIEDTNAQKTQGDMPPAVTTGRNSTMSTQQIAGAIVLAGIIIAGAILLKGNAPVVTTAPTTAGIPVTTTTGTVSPVGVPDRVLGSSTAKVTLIMYEDFQCPFCGMFVKNSESVIRNTYVKNNTVELVYRDYAFLGAGAKANGSDPVDESLVAAEAARCAGDQGQFWQYHDYLFAHQNGEDQGAFSVAHLESFATAINLNSQTFNQCLESSKYAKTVIDSTAEGATAGVTGTPKGFILVNGKVVDTIDGALPTAAVTVKLDTALKD
jgi:protein-disulfide isomerase